jgi:Ca2+-binding RTX toxin-like protein
LNGTSANETLIGQGGDNALFGNGGNDRLVTTSGNNWLQSASGNDTLVSGTGGDWMTGGGGQDVFVLHANNGGDIIVDFVRGTDKLDFVDQTAAQVTWHVASKYGYDGLAVDHGATSVFLIGVSTLSASDMIFG